MKTVKVQIIVFLAFAVFTACKKPTGSGNVAVGNRNASQYQHAQGGTTPQGPTKYFKGSIGNTLGLQMKLAREGEKLTGSYYYQKVGTRIDLSGTIDKDGNVTLAEFDPAGKQTGTFQGIWKTDDDGLISIAGNWNGPVSARKTTFSLHEEPIEFSNGVEIAAKRITEKNKKLGYEIDVEYPQLTGSGSANFDKFNQTMRSLITGKVNEFRKEMVPEAGQEDGADVGQTSNSDLNIEYTLAMAKNDLISLDFNVSSYYRGAAHPNSYTETVNFDLNSGKLLKLSDLFNPGSKYLTAISAYAIHDLQKQSKSQGADSMLDNDWIQRGAGPDTKNYQSWTITKAGLEITFDSYQVAPYAAGPQHVVVPYSALNDFIRVDGALGQFLK